MRHPVSKDLYAYWNRLRGARAAPDRGDINPADIRHVLADSFILEVDSESLFPIRLCGTRLNALRLIDQKGKSFLDFWRQEDRRSVAAALLTTIDGATPIVAGAQAAPPSNTLNLDDLDSPFDSNRNCEMSFELLLLPLRHFGKTHARLLGSLASADQPAWFGRVGASPLSLSSLRVIKAQEVETSQWPASPGHRSLAIGGKTPRLVVYEGGMSKINRPVLQNS
jgi:hypothetical protein